MSDKANVFASQLLLHVTNSGDVADLLVAKSGDRICGSLHRDVQPSVDVAFKTAKLSAETARYIAKKTNSSQLLAQLAEKEKRKTVLRAIAGNRHISQETALMLIEWGEKNFDFPVVSNACRSHSFTWQDLKNLIDSKGEGFQGYAIDSLAALIAADGSRKAFEALLELADSRVKSRVVLLLWSNPDKLETFLSLFPADEQQNLLYRSVNSADRPVDTKQARLVRQVFDDVNPTDSQLNRSLVWMFDNTVLTPQAALLFADSPHPMIRALVFRSSELSDAKAREMCLTVGMKQVAVRGVRTDDSFLISTAISSREPEALNFLAGVALNGQHLDDLIDTIEWMPEQTARKLASKIWHGCNQLDPERKLSLLRLGDFDTTLSWLSLDEGAVNEPVAGELSQLLDEPGWAFSPSVHFSKPEEEQTPSKRAKALLGVSRSWHPVIVEAIDRLESFMVVSLDNTRLVTARLVELLFERFGDNPEAFQLALALGPEWSSTIPELVETISITMSTPKDG